MGKRVIGESICVGVIAPLYRKVYKKLEFAPVFMGVQVFFKVLMCLVDSIVSSWNMQHSFLRGKAFQIVGMCFTQKCIRLVYELESERFGVHMCLVLIMLYFHE